jgi:hypothetical protein
VELAARLVSAGTVHLQINILHLEISDPHLCRYSADETGASGPQVLCFYNVRFFLNFPDPGIHGLSKSRATVRTLGSMPAARQLRRLKMRAKHTTARNENSVSCRHMLQLAADC